MSRFNLVIERDFMKTQMFNVHSLLTTLLILCLALGFCIVSATEVTRVNSGSPLILLEGQSAFVLQVPQDDDCPDGSAIESSGEMITGPTEYSPKDGYCLCIVSANDGGDLDPTNPDSSLAGAGGTNTNDSANNDNTNSVGPSSFRGGNNGDANDDLLGGDNPSSSSPPGCTEEGWGPECGTLCEYYPNNWTCSACTRDMWYYPNCGNICEKFPDVCQNLDECTSTNWGPNCGTKSCDNANWAADPANGCPPLVAPPGSCDNAEWAADPANGCQSSAVNEPPDCGVNQNQPGCSGYQEPCTGEDCNKEEPPPCTEDCIDLNKIDSDSNDGKFSSIEADFESNPGNGNEKSEIPGITGLYGEQKKGENWTLEVTPEFCETYSCPATITLYVKEGNGNGYETHEITINGPGVINVPQLANNNNGQAFKLDFSTLEYKVVAAFASFAAYGSDDDAVLNPRGKGKGASKGNVDGETNSDTEVSDVNVLLDKDRDRFERFNLNRGDNSDKTKNSRVDRYTNIGKNNINRGGANIGTRGSSGDGFTNLGRNSFSRGDTNSGSKGSGVVDRSTNSGGNSFSRGDTNSGSKGSDVVDRSTNSGKGSGTGGGRSTSGGGSRLIDDD